MKIIKVVFFSLLALCLVACTGIFIFFQTFDTDQFLPKLTQKVSLALGRPVIIGGVGLGLSSRGITLDAGPVTIADDPAFTAQPFIKVDRVRIRLDLRSLVLEHKVHITGILLQSPQIHLIRSQDGNFNIKSIGNNKAVSQNPVEAVSSLENVPQSSYQTPLVSRNDKIKVDVDFMKVHDASVSFIDQNHTFPLDIWLNGISANLNDFSLSKPFQLSFDACLLSNVPNVKVNAVLSLDPSKHAVHISDIRLHMDLSHLDIDQLRSISPGMSDSPIFKNIAGIVQLNMSQLDIGASGDITASGDISITGGVIKDFNIIKTILSQTLGAFGGMESNIDNLLNGQLKDKLGAKDTIIEKAQVKFSLHDRTVFIDDSLIQTNIFEFKAKGSVDYGLNMDMQTLLHLNDDISGTLANELDGLKYLMDDSKRITVDASLKGAFPHLKYKPSKDFRKKSKKFYMSEGGAF